VEGTLSYQAYYLSPAYFLLFMVLVGFIYHLIRNKEYKNTLPASVIIGIIFGLVFNSGDTPLFFLERTLLFIILIVIGGFIAVGLKKLKDNNVAEKQKVPPKTSSKGYRKWWNNQNPKIQAAIVTGFCLLCLTLIIGIFCLLNPVENPVQLSVDLPLSNQLVNQTEADKAMEEGITLIFISNNTTQYTLNGSSEAGATVKITSSDLGIYNQIVPLDAEGNFAYNLNIPQNVSIIKISLEAAKSGKEDSFFNLTIKKTTHNNLGIV
jgi:uncharacterized membrane protein